MIHLEVQAHIFKLAQVYPGITEIWLIGSRANGNARIDSDWDLLMFADSETFLEITKRPEFKQPGVDLLVVYDNLHFQEPWPESADGYEPKTGALRGLGEWDWERISDVDATYTGTKVINGMPTMQTKKAIRLWPLT